MSTNLKFKTVLVLILMFFADVVTSQTLISPAGDGGFESGITFAANNWSVANGGNPKRNWYVGTGQSGFTGLRCAFIGNNTTTVGTDGSARIQHLYKSITVPAGATNIQLSFKYKQAVSDYAAGIYYDYISVYTDVVAPTGGTAPGGTLVFGPYPNANTTTFTTQSATLSNALAGTTTNLIFTFNCDNLPPDGYGAVDDISLTYTPAPMPTITNLLLPSSGCVGSNITITGTNFTGATAANVKIGGTPVASITSNTGTTIIAVIGAGTTGTVSVTTAGGTATSIGVFSVNPNPAAIGGGAATVCTGVNTIAFTDATAGGTWSTSSGTGSASISAGGIATGTALGTVTVLYTLPTTCSVSKALTVQQTPGAIAGGAASVCVGSSTPAFTNLNAGGVWTVVNGSGTATITAGGVLTGTAPGNVTVNYTIGLCTPATYSVTVNPSPTAPTVPVNSLVTSSGFTVSWTASVGAINYVLEVYTDAGRSIPVSGSPFIISSPTTSYAVTGLNSATSYYYQIKATNINCSSAYLLGTVTTVLTNDECSGAISLTVSTTCSYTTYTNAGATGSTGMTTPACANYLGGDVWFSAVVPATGELDVDLIEGVMTDSGMAFYSGTCGSLTLLDCDDDSSNNGLMSYISRSGLTPGQTIYIRVWEYGNNNNGTFGICATTPSCPSPSNLYPNILSNTSVTVNWNASTPSASGGYQYFINTTGVTPTSSTIPTSTTSAGVISVTLTGLTTGQKYYFWVRSFCGGTDVSTWFGPTNYSPCAVGNGTGNTTNACPSIIAGGQGLNGASPPAVMCSASTCTSLEATYLQLNQPTNYSVSSIPYVPPYQYTCLQNPVSVNVDDVWSPTINLPFDFCFFGNNYNKCLIGSNGVITFDTTSNTPGGYSTWSYNSDLPNVSLFKNTIFGVYHDIDPSKGGQVGWELITLNTGCRALVASWNNIPMYSSSCNASLYTGMIVLYENTNVIEVYIKEKNICSTWNNGNAIVGIQNAAGTAAVVAPNRNGLSTDWSTTNEAWRFVPTGPSLTSIKWFQGNSTSGTQIGTTDIINVCPTVTTTYTAEVTYALCSGNNLKYTGNVLVTVNGNKIWNGTQSPDWNTPNNWTPSGVPTNANCVIIPTTANNPIISNSPDAVGYNLLVYNNAQLTLNTNKNLTIVDKVTVQPSGVFTINNSASLIQINNILNSGNIICKRDASNVRTLDYVYWSSPVANFNVDNIVSPYSFGPIYKWNTTIANSNGGQGTWQTASGTTMIAGKGYIARSPSASPFNNTTFNTLNGTFTGVPNNGDITIPIERGTDQNTALHYGTNGIQVTNLSDNWNLLGNPYPSAIRGSQFLFDNNTKIEGNIRLWTHGTLPSNLIQNPFYSSFVYNYTTGDYLTYNFTGTSCCPAAASDVFIGAGQGFFVQMIDGSAVSTTDNVTVSFNNNLRNASFSNNVFYRTINSTTSSTTFDVNTIERNRIWLDLVNPNGQSDRTLFGYIENATMGRDSFFDCITQNYGGTQLYSEIGDTKFSIQGRSLPFDVNDEVPIGINIPTQGNYTIAIAGIDGLFNSQNIYLRDILLNITHDLKVSPYSFSSNTGAINDRFKVIYLTNALGTSNTAFENNVKVMTNKKVVVNSSNLLMETIIVYNVLGQKIATYDNINSNDLILTSLNKNNATLLLEIKLQTGGTVIKKIIY
ncbi:IPT/TIG domain-containing protein [Flavobacterium sp.]|uniref:fibronectin type III domain-containing protein n=1 Tax=Flavobacterium sp. TaxID=239 RepID=UPI0025EA258D|nr:IPT/TIG domain-containing protein [Flavobacterium sp.]